MTEISYQPLPEKDECKVSKTQIKQELHALKAMGRRLIALKPDQIGQLPLTDSLRDAIKEAYRIKSNNARKRHLGYIGKLMQLQDIEAIEELLNRLDSKRQANAEFFHQIEHWRDSLLGEQWHNALTEFVAGYSKTDVQHLRQLVRKAQKENKEGKSPANRRKLFRYIREICDQEIYGNIL